MGWNDIANNQAVTSSNLQNAVDIGKFTALTTFASSNNCVTKAEAISWVNCWQGYSPLAAKSSDQLVVKSDLVTTTTTSTTTTTTTTSTTTTTTSGILAVINMGYIYDAGDIYFQVGVSSGTTSDNISFSGTMRVYTNGTCTGGGANDFTFSLTLNAGSSSASTLIGVNIDALSYKIISCTAGGTNLTTDPQTITVNSNQYQIFNFNVCMSGA